MRWVTKAAVVLAVCNLVPHLATARESKNEVPFKLYRGYAIVARGSIGSLKNLNFLIDTGTVPSVLDRRTAQKLHLTGTTEGLSVFTKTVDAERGMASNVQLGPLHADALAVVIHDLSFAEEALGTRVDAMIGFDFLGQSAFTIDYAAKKITFGPIDASLDTIPYEAHPGYLVVEMQVKQKKLSLLVDTGASDLVLFGAAVRDCAEAIKNVRSRTWSNMGGEIRVKQVQLSETYLGNTVWGSQDVFILDDNGENPVAGLDGLLGVISLKSRRVGFDPVSKILAWDRSSSLGKP